MPIKLVFTIIRWVVAVILMAFLIFDPFFAADIIEKFRPDSNGEPMRYFIAAGTLLVSVGLMWDLLAWVVSYPMRNFFGSIFYPNETVIPPPNYNAAQLYRDQGRLDEAVDIYLGILKHHPQEVLAYIDGIKTCFDADQPETAEKIAGMATRITEIEVRGHIVAIYQTAKDEYAQRPVLDETVENTEDGVA